ncbi:MAG: Mur ligase family protein [Candidatus Taylorbacteria bacterium]
MEKKHIHVVGIAGVATSAIAIALTNVGWKVTGSDKGFFPPVSDALEKASIPFYAGWHPEKMTQNGTPDMVMIGGSGKSSKNPEMIFAREHNIPIFSYPEIIEKYFLRANSLVCAGTWGKTTTSALLSFIFEEAGKNPTYMFGGLSRSQNESAKLSEGDWSILEGDEYTGSQTDNVAKFLHYHPTHLLMTSIFWDHADVYSTPELYFRAFEKLIEKMGKKSVIVACRDDLKATEICQKAEGAKIITYGKSDGDYRYTDVKSGKEGISFVIEMGGEKFAIRSPMLGAFQAENISGAFAMALLCGINRDTIVVSIANFKGLKRRIEKRYGGEITVIDDIAHSPQKAKAVLSTLKEIYSGNIYAVFEPNQGGRERSSLPQYAHAFKDAYEIIIPKLSSIKSKIDSSKAFNLPLQGSELAKIISQTHPKSTYIESDDKLVKHLKETARPGDCIVFLGSHSFRGMIVELIGQIQES